MPPNDLPFEQFFAEKIKERGVSLKKLSEITGIAPSHIENLLRGDYENMPSAPYFHGYMLHLGAVLDFDGEEWWARLKKEGVDKKFRRARHDAAQPVHQTIPAKIFVVDRRGRARAHLSRVPGAAHFREADAHRDLARRESVRDDIEHVHARRHGGGADSLYLVGANGGQEQIIIAADGSWQKGVLLGIGPIPSRSPQRSSWAAKQA